MYLKLSSSTSYYLEKAIFSFWPKWVRITLIFSANFITNFKHTTRCMYCSMLNCCSANAMVLAHLNVTFQLKLNFHLLRVTRATDEIFDFCKNQNTPQAICNNLCYMEKMHQTTQKRSKLPIKGEKSVCHFQNFQRAVITAGFERSGKFSVGINTVPRGVVCQILSRI